MKKTLLYGIGVVLLLACTRVEKFRQFVTKDYVFDVNTIHFSLDKGELELKFPELNEFQHWYMSVFISDYKDNKYRFSGDLVFSQNQTSFTIPNLPKSYTVDSIKELGILANQQKCRMFRKGQPIQRPFYKMTLPGVLTINEDISKTKVIRIELEAWQLKAEDQTLFKMYLDSLLEL